MVFVFVIHPSKKCIRLIVLEQIYFELLSSSGPGPSPGPRSGPGPVQVRSQSGPGPGPGPGQKTWNWANTKFGLSPPPPTKLFLGST